MLSSPATPPEGAWVHAEFDWLRALRAVFPDGPLQLDAIALASPFATIAEIAGLGVNRAGSSYDIANVRWHAGSAPPDAPPPAKLTVTVHGVHPLDDFEQDLGEWHTFGGTDGAVL